MRTARRRIGLASSAVLQRLRPTLTAHDVVVTGVDATLEPWWSTYSDADHERADALLAWVGCAGHVGQELATLSEGERKRVLVARLLMPDPELLLFDEPCAGLDLGGRESLVAVLGELAQGERPLVMVTHHLEEIPPGFTHALLLRDGRGGRGRPDLGDAVVGRGLRHLRGRGHCRLRRDALVHARHRALTIRTFTGFASGNDGWLATRNTR